MRQVSKRLATLVALACVLAPGLAFSDGTEALGPPSIPIAMGTGTVLAGTGLAEGQPANITIDVPGAPVQVLLYWEGQTLANLPDLPDDTILIDGNLVVGTQIGGPTAYIGPFTSTSFRADITALGLIGMGNNVVSVDGLDFVFENDGAGILVIYDDGGPLAEIDIRDGNDFAFVGPGLLGSTVRQDFSFLPSAVDRTADLSIFVASVADDTGLFGFRPSSIDITVDGFVHTFSNLLNSVDGTFWDSHTLTVPVPAGAMDISIQLFSRDDSMADPLAKNCVPGVIGECPASLAWVAGSLTLFVDDAPGCDVDVEKTCCIPAPPAPGLDECEGKALELVLEYTGKSCAAGNNTQAGKAKCEGDPAFGAPVAIVFTGKAAGELLAVPSSGIQIGDEVRITRPGKELKASTKFEIVGGAQTQKLTIHTSCSKTLALDDQFGAMKVVEITSTQGGTVSSGAPAPQVGSACEPPPVNDGVCEARLVEAVFEYIGEGCADPLANPQEGKARCSGDPAGASPVSIVYNGKAADQITVSPAMGIEIGDEFRVTATGRDELHADTKLQILDGTVLQDLKIHTSCSKPLAIGDVFGAVRLIGFTDKNGVVGSLPSNDPLELLSECELEGEGVVEYQYHLTNLAAGPIEVDVDDSELGQIASGLVLGGGESVTLFETATITATTTNVVTVTATQGAIVCDQAEATVTIPPPPPPTPRSCDDGKPQRLVFHYTGDDCSATTNDQEGKAECAGPLAGEAPVEIVYVGKDPNQIEVVETGESIAIGGAVTLNAFDRSRLHAETLLEVRQGGVVLQSLNIHTSCSKVLVVGDQFGSLVLDDLIPE